MIVHLIQQHSWHTFSTFTAKDTTHRKHLRVANAARDQLRNLSVIPGHRARCSAVSNLTEDLGVTEAEHAVEIKYIIDVS